MNRTTSPAPSAPRRVSPRRPHGQSNQALRRELGSMLDRAEARSVVRPVPSSARTWKGSRAWIALGLSGALVIAGAVLVEAPASAHGDPAPVVPVASEPTVDSLMRLCRSFSDREGNTLDWARAADECQRAIDADPINVEARRLHKLAVKELAEERLFEAGDHLFELGEATDAITQLARVDSDSFYFTQARSDVRRAAPIALARAGGVCVSEVKAGLWDRAWADCQQMMSVGAYLGLDDTEQHRSFRRAFDESRRHAHATQPWVAPPELARFFDRQDASTDPVALRAKAIRAEYADAALADAVIQYGRDPLLGMQAVQRYIGKGGRDEAQARDVYRHMETATGSHQSGYEAMLRFDLKAAAAAFRDQLEADARVMPAGFESDLAKQTRRDISEAFAKRGKELSAEGRLPEAFAQCQGGGEFQLGNLSVLECLGELEDKAASLVGQGCGGAAQAAAITRKDSPTHKRAEQVARAGGC